MSQHDIRAGDRWADKLNNELQETRFGIAVITHENLEAPWIHFEAGAVAKHVGEASVCPYLVDVESESELTGTLTQFQARKADRAGTLDLLKALNHTLGDDKLLTAVLEDSFNRFWGDLDGTLRNLPSSTVPEPRRTERELLEEIQERVRSLGRRAERRQPVDLGVRDQIRMARFVERYAANRKQLSKPGASKTYDADDLTLIEALGKGRNDSGDEE